MLSLHCCLGFSLVAVSRGYASLGCSHFSLQWPLLLGSTGFRHMGFSNCTAWSQELQFTGLVAQRQVWSSQTRDQTHVSRIGRHIHYHWATGEAPTCIFCPQNYPGRQYLHLTDQEAGLVKVTQLWKHLDSQEDPGFQSSALLHFVSLNNYWNWSSTFFLLDLFSLGLLVLLLSPNFHAFNAFCTSSLLCSILAHPSFSWIEEKW